MIKENRFVSEISGDLTKNTQFPEIKIIFPENALMFPKKCVKYNIDVYKCCELRRDGVESVHT